MRFFVIIGITALILTNGNAEFQEKSKELRNVSNENISASLQETLEKLRKMTIEQKLNALTELTYSANNFSLNLYKHIVSGKRRNVVVPAFAIFQSVSFLAWASIGNTKRQIHEVLNLPRTQQRIFAGFEKINRKLQDAPWSSHNNLLFRNDSNVTSDIENIGARIYSTDLHFTSLPLPPENFIPFSESHSHCRIESVPSIYPVMFTNMDGSKTKYRTYLRLTGKYRHGQVQDIEATFVEIPCENKYKPRSTEPKVRSTKMFILLPNRVNGLDELETNIGRLNISKLSTGDLRDVNITIPVKSAYSYSNVTNTLSKMGLMEMFSKNAEIFVTARRSQAESFKIYGSLEIGRKTIPDSAVPSFINETVIVDRPFISVITTADENPLILHIACITSLES